MSDPFDLDRFVRAQAPVMGQVERELDAGDKRSHWMWFVFPQIAGLGGSPMARRYAIACLDEARAYLAHPVLGPRLVACTDVVNGLSGRSAHDIFGSPDDLKFRSSMTLFDCVQTGMGPFRIALSRYFNGVADSRTLAILNSCGGERTETARPPP